MMTRVEKTDFYVFTLKERHLFQDFFFVVKPFGGVFKAHTCIQQSLISFFEFCEAGLRVCTVEL